MPKRRQTWSSKYRLSAGDVPVPGAHVGGPEGKVETGLVFRAASPHPFCAPVMSRKTRTAPMVLPSPSLIGGAAVVDGDLRPIFPYEHGMVGQANDDPFPEHPGDRVFYRLAGLLVDDVEHLRDRSPGCVTKGPAGQAFSDRVQERDPAALVCSDDRVADARQRNPQPFTLLLYDVLRCLQRGRSFSHKPLRDVPGAASVPSRSRSCPWLSPRVPKGPGRG